MKGFKMLKKLKDLADIDEIAIECGSCKTVVIIKIDGKKVKHCPSCEKNFLGEPHKELKDVQDSLDGLLRLLKFYKEQGHFSIKIVASDD